MSEVDPDVPVEEAREALERLYDDPDERIPELLSYGTDEGAIEAEHAVFRALANEDRLRVVEALREGERCGCELMAILDAPQSTVATHLRKLREAGIVKSRRKGRWSYYRIADPAVADVLDLAASVGGA